MDTKQLEQFLIQEIAALEQRLLDLVRHQNKPDPSPCLYPHKQSRTLAEQMFKKEGHELTEEERNAVRAARSRNYRKRLKQLNVKRMRELNK